MEASERSHVVQLPLVIRNWGSSAAALEVVGKDDVIPKNIRIGRVSTLEGDDLIVWIPVKSTSPLRIRIRPAFMVQGREKRRM